MSRILLLAVALFMGISALVVVRGNSPLAQASVATTRSFDLWPEFSVEKQFSAKLPVLPTHTKEGYDMYLAEQSNGTVYLISVIAFTELKKTPDELLEAILVEMLAAKPGNKLTKTEKVTHQALPALDFTLEGPEVTLANLVFVSDKSVYVLSYVAKNDQVQSEERAHFVDSFKLMQ